MSLTKSSILGALSVALDMVEGQPEGHALRTCLLASRIGKEIRLDDRSLGELYFAALLKDTGCSNNSVRVQKIFGGDEILAKFDVKLVDWTSSIESVKYAFAATERGQSLATKLRRMLSNIAPPGQIMNEVTAARCTRGAEIATMLGFSANVADAVRNLDEHWDGKGSPMSLSGESIPLLARIICLAQTFEVFLTAFGRHEAYAMLDKRNRKWFDPQLVAACREFQNDSEFWDHYRHNAYEEALHVEIPAVEERAEEIEVDTICRSFAMIIDAKSSFTWEHSSRVTDYAVGLASWFGLSEDRVTDLRRASLMHDIGKLGVPTSILEKPGKLEPEEFDRVRAHPKNSFEILRRVPGFDRIAEIASGHHERLDGRGYWQGLSGDQIDLETRILTSADVFDALSAKRPYRDALPIESVFDIMDKDAGTGLDNDCLQGLKEQHLFASAAAA